MMLARKSLGGLPTPPAISGRYFRLKCTDGRTGYYAIAELRFIDATESNVAQGKPVTTTAWRLSASYDIPKIVDGVTADSHTNTYISASGQTNPIITVDFGGAKNIVRYQLVAPHPAASIPGNMTRSWDIQKSDDQVLWETVHTVTNDPAWTSLEEREYVL
ncbi:galactose-binding domain-containing protein [Marinobacterium sedimentorum]|uniref:galactose-binding domain-containing protein n=1 Tax=Marinobacterium sedimentorum TaxID=2927804 RepID=UPI0020C6E380|nr:hypothetical protein [Marinobacterium sedimentorum]MCP8687750.1 hypothetical protein [Marinobacterium sedimentorum]